MATIILCGQLFTLPALEAQVVRVDAVTSAQKFFGNYRRDDGSLISIGRSDESVFTMDYRSGERHQLTADSSGTLSDSAEHGETLALRTDPRGVTLVARGGAASWAALRLPIVHNDVEFHDGDVTLRGTLWEPAGAGPFPAIILLHGAGQETRFAMRQYPYFFVSLGYAVLTYDKRGSGKSTGEWQPWNAGIDVLAADAAAAVQLLRARHDVRADHVGLLGISNGAWVTVRAATHTPGISFVIPIVGSGIPIWRQELYRIHNSGVALGLNANNVTALDQFMSGLYSSALFDSLPRPAAIARIDSLRLSAHGTPWLSVTPLAAFVSAPSGTVYDLGRESWRRELSYDPTADLRMLTQPMLAILGGADVDVPTRLVAASLSSNVPTSKHGTRMVYVIPGASHYLLLADDSARSTVDRFDPKLFETLRRWLALRAPLRR
ncbi:MAG: alpha/beta fold hydrolase [Gemmatimonadota bacterium]|nr:alpha/beta fold hydrolase [Gemmatimonadota bacterium]